MTENNLALWERLGKVYGPVSARIEARITPEPNTGCWLWLGAVGRRGYGTMTINGQTAMAHRASYEAFVGPIPDGLHIDHLCKVRSCVNPGHLEPVTPAENAARSPKPITLQSHCKHGHPFIGENLIWKGKQRACRECSRRVALASYHRRQANG